MDESEEQRVMNDLTGLSSGFNSMSLKCSYEFRMMNFILEWWKEHWKIFYQTVWKQCQENHV